MADPEHRWLERIDRVGGRLYARFWGSVLLLALVFVALPMAIGSIASGHWGGAAVVVGASIPVLWLVRHLFSSKRRLNEIE